MIVPESTPSPTIEEKESIIAAKARPTPLVSLSWSNITYDIPLPKKKKTSKKDEAEEDRVTETSIQSQGDVEKGLNVNVGDSAESVPLAAGHRRILSGIGGFVNKGEVVAILGASGAGKTTLLNILSARLGPVGKLEGKVLFHGQPRDQRTWKRTVGFVEQEDVMLGHLTVQETLDYAARMRMPDRLYSKKQKLERVKEIINILRLNKCKDSRIGTATSRGISGGERKRTSIGMELISDVSLMLLDEPTSGLDAYAAYSVVENLCSITRSRELTCLMTIHQPSWALLSLVDRVQFLTQGKVYYEGPPKDMLAWFTSIGYVVPEGANPADYYITIAENPDESEQGKARVQKLIQAWADKEAIEKQRAASSTPEENTGNSDRPVLMDDDYLKAYQAWPISRMREIMTLSERNLIQMARDRDTLFGGVGQSIVVLIVVGFAFFRLGRSQADVLSRIGVLFFLVINIVFSVQFPILTPFPLQRAVMIRERSAGTYRASSFFLSKALVDIPINVLQKVPFFSIFYWMVGLKAEASAFFIFLGIGSVQVVVGVCLGLLIGSVSRGIEIANILAPMAGLIFLLFGGNLLPSPPPWFIWLHYISPLTYSYSALAQIEFTGQTFECGAAGSQCYSTGEQVIQQYNLDTFTPGESVGFLFAIIFVFSILGYCGLRITAHPRFRYV